MLVNVIILSQMTTVAANADISAIVRNAHERAASRHRKILGPDRNTVREPTAGQPMAEPMSRPEYAGCHPPIPNRDPRCRGQERQAETRIAS